MASEKEREEVALKKAALVLPLLEPNLLPADRVKRQKEIAESADLSYRTLSRYVSTYVDVGFDGLKPKKQNRELVKVISIEVLKKAIELRRENPHRSVSDIIKILEMEKIVEPGTLHRSTLQRALQEAGYSKRQMKMYLAPTTGKVATRFQKVHRMQLLQGDGKYGPYLPIGENGELVQTYFIGWIDDASRFIVFGRFYSSFKAVDVLDSLKEAIIRYGVPLAIYCDNGSQYVASSVKTACAILKIKLKRTPYYSGKSKGKIEKFNGLLDKFITEATLEKFQTLEELNAYYLVWQDEYYNNHVHRELTVSPKTAFYSDTTPFKFVDIELINRAITDTGERIVAKDGSISIDGKLYVVTNLNLIGFKVQYSRLASNKDDIIIYKDGYETCKALPLEIGEDIDYKVRNSIVAADKGVIETDKSRMLRGLAERYKARHPDTELKLERPLSVKEEEISNFISYSSKEEEKDD